jgi:hypothetical protein
MAGGGWQDPDRRKLSFAEHIQNRAAVIAPPFAFHHPLFQEALHHLAKNAIQAHRCNSARHINEGKDHYEHDLRHPGHDRQASSFERRGGAGFRRPSVSSGRCRAALGWMRQPDFALSADGGKARNRKAAIMSALKMDNAFASSGHVRELSETEIGHVAGGFAWLVLFGPLLLSACVNVNSNNGSANGTANGDGK